MRTSRSVFPTAVLSCVIGLTGCLSDQSNASGPTPAGIWLISSNTHDITSLNGNDILTETTGRQLVVLEESGHKEFRLHDCATDTPLHNQKLTLSRAGDRLLAAVSYTDHDTNTPYSESEKISLTLEGNVLRGSASSYDRNLDGSYDSVQNAYFEGHKISAAQTLEALSQAEIKALLGDTLNRDSVHNILGKTCTGVARASSTGTIRGNRIDTPMVTDILRPEPQPDLMIAGDATH